MVCNCNIIVYDSVEVNRKSMVIGKIFQLASASQTDRSADRCNGVAIFVQIFSYMLRYVNTCTCIVCVHLGQIYYFIYICIYLLIYLRDVLQK